MNKKSQDEDISQRQKEIFVKNLKYYLDKTGKLQKDVSDALGMSQCAVSDWMKFRAYPRMNKIQQMAELFGCEISDLVEEHSLSSKKYTLKTSKKLAEEFADNPQAFELYQKIKKLSDADRAAILMMIDRLGGDR